MVGLLPGWVWNLQSVPEVLRRRTGARTAFYFPPLVPAPKPAPETRDYSPGAQGNSLCPEPGPGNWGTQRGRQDAKVEGPGPPGCPQRYAAPPEPHLVQSSAGSGEGKVHVGDTADKSKPQLEGSPGLPPPLGTAPGPQSSQSLRGAQTAP